MVELDCKDLLQSKSFYASMNIATPFHNKILLIVAAMHVILSKYLYANTFEKNSTCGFFNNI